MNIDEYLVDLIVDAILEDICRRTDEWADPTGEKAVILSEINTHYNRKEIRSSAGRATD